jgi:hypothetical protein
MRGRWWSLRALERRSGRNRRQVTSSCDRIECRNASVHARSARRSRRHELAQAGEQKQKAVRLEQLERSLVGHGETETLSTVRLEYRCKSSPRSPPVLKKRKAWTRLDYSRRAPESPRRVPMAQSGLLPRMSQNWTVYRDFMRLSC